MKNLFFLLLACLFITVQSKPIANLKIDDEVNTSNIFSNKFYILDTNGKIKYLTENDIKQIWEKRLVEEGYITQLEKFEILKSKDEKTGKNFYFLKVESKDQTIETGAFFTKTKFGMLLGEKKCTCVGCASGCSLRTFGSDCSCTSCGIGGPQDCKKTEEGTVKTSFGFEETNMSTDLN